MDAATLRVLREVQAIVPGDALEREQQADTVEWIRSGGEIFRRQKPATPPKHLVSYCVVVDVDVAAVLLVDHIDAGLWLPTGGHVEPGEDPRDTVVRETAEELALDVTRADVAAPLFLSVEETVGQTAGHIDVSLWYVVRGSMDDRLAPDHTEFRSFRWVPFDRIGGDPEIALGPHVDRFVAKLRSQDCKGRSR